MTAPLVIVGSGLAGYTLAREFRKRDTATPLIIVSADAGQFYAKPSLSNALAQGRVPAQLASETATQAAARLAASLRVHTRIDAIDCAGRRLLGTDGEIAYGRLVLALGADPIAHGLIGDGVDRVHAVNDLDDYARFRAALAGRRKVAILGGGLIGCEFANDLAATGHAVEVVHRGAWPLDRLLPEAVGQAMAAALGDKGVSWHFRRMAVAAAAAGDGVVLELDDGGRVKADLVLSAIGLRPRTALAAAAGLAIGRGIVVDRQLRTGNLDIHALGDCAEVDGLVLPFVQPILAQARVLAAVLAGEAARLVYPAMPVLVKTPAFPLVVAPPLAGQGEWQVEATAHGMVARHLDPAGHLNGFALAGGETGRRLEFAQQLPAWLD